MQTNANHPGYFLDHLSNDELLASTRRLVGHSNQVLAALLAHLGEVEARGIHRERACASLYTYCIYELRMSEDAAFRRARAAKFVRQFPVLLDRIGSGEIHLTALLMLGPHLTEENHREVLARAKHRTKKEIARLVRMLDPLPDVHARVEPLGPGIGPLLVPSNPSWEKFVSAMCPVRELCPGDRPKDWIDSEAGSLPPLEAAEPRAPEQPVEAQSEVADPPIGGRREHAESPLVVQRYKVQFTATHEYVELLEQAQALLGHAVTDGALGEIHLRAMRALVAELNKRKHAVTDKPRSNLSPELAGTRASAAVTRRQPGRYIPAPVRRAVWERDGGRCSYVDATGQRCRETGRLELHHVEAYARGGPPTVCNLTLRCASHNALAAEQDFGRDFIARKKGTLGAGQGLSFEPVPRQRGSDTQSRYRAATSVRASP